jgi:serine/threonine protein kinase
MAESGERGEKEALREERRKLFKKLADHRLIYDDAELNLQLNIKGKTFVMGKCLGHGGYGTVWEGTRKGNKEEKRAVKFSDAFKLQDQDQEEDKEKAEDIRRFYREVSAAKKLGTEKNSPYPRYIAADFLENPDDKNERIVALIMEKIEGKTLEKFLPRRKLYKTPEITLNTALQIAKAVEFTHARGYVHRDIRPDNFIVQEDGKVRIIDLGLVVLVEAQKGEGGPRYKKAEDREMGGAGYFLKNEQDPFSFERDIYALGKIFNQLVKGEEALYQQLALSPEAAADDRLVQLNNLAARMILPGAADRPSISAIITKLEALQAT